MNGIQFILRWKLMIIVWLLFPTIYTNSEHNKDDSVIYIRTQSLYPPYIDHQLANRWYDFGGSTVVNTNRYVRLTPEFQARKGWLRSKTPFYADSWSIEFEYKVHGRASLAGDGFAFWYTNERVDKLGSLLGGPEKWNGLVVAFDTYDNGRHGYSHPYVAALYNDGTRTYNKDNDGKDLELGGCEADVRNKDQSTRARIRYIKDKYLKVELNTGGWDKWSTCVYVEKVKLFPMGFISFTGETGGLTDNHDILSISTNQILKDEQDSNANLHKSSSDSSSTSNHHNPPQPDHYYNNFNEPISQGPSYLMITLFILVLGGIVYFGANKMGFLGPSQRDLKHF